MLHFSQKMVMINAPRLLLFFSKTMKITRTPVFSLLVKHGHIVILAFTCGMSREEFKLPNLFKEKGEKPGKYQC